MKRKIQVLANMGFLIGKRDPRLNRAFKGQFMISERYEISELPTDDAHNGPWCIVGDNLNALVTQAFEYWTTDYTDKK